MKLDQVTNEIIMAASSEAEHRNHEFITPEHVLYAALFFDDAVEIIMHSGGDAETLKNELNLFLIENIPVSKDRLPFESNGLQNVMEQTALHAMSSGKKTINIGDIIIAIYEEQESFAAYYLEKQGISKLDVLNYISHGVSKIADASVFDREIPSSSTKNKDSEKDFLSKFTVDLTELAKNGEIDPVIGRQDIINRTLQVLCRRLKNNPVHVGEPGVGKTAITEGLALKIIAGDVPKPLKDNQIFYIDMAAVLAGTKYRGDFEERLKTILNEIKKIEKAIIYIDEIHTTVGAGAVSGGAMDASNILKPFLTSGKLRCIGSTTYEEYKKYFDKDRALSRRFQKVEVTEPTVEDTYEILQGLKSKYEEYHDVVYTEEALKAAAELSAKYIHDRYLPDKAIDVIDETGANIRLKPDRDDQVVTITEREIEHTVSLIARIPEQNVSTNEVKTLKNLDKKIKQVIFGQDQAVKTVVKAIRRSRAGFNDTDKPIASLLFVGPTGVGKTELSRQLSNLFGIPLIRFDMSEYQEKHSVSRLIGSPPGYVGFDEGGQLTETIRKNPYAVLLLDEIEKAHGDIFNVLLQIMDYATLTDNNGKKADFRNVILIMTSNAGAREIGKNVIGFDNRKVNTDVMTDEIKRFFAPEFRNRLDSVVVFNHIDADMALKIAKKAVKEFEQKLEPKKVSVKVTAKAYKWLADKGFSSEFGAREIYRLVQEKIKSYFVDEVLFGELAQGGQAKIDIKKDDIFVSVIEKKATKEKSKKNPESEEKKSKK